MSDEIKLGDIVVFKTDNRAFEVIGKYIVPDDRLWRVEAITEDDPPTPDRNRKYRLVAVDCPNVMLDEIPEIYVESYSEKLERELEEQRKEALKMNRNEIKQGDKVRVSSRVPRIYERFGSMIAPHYECKVVEIDDGMALLDSIPAKHIFLFPLKYLVKVDAEAKEAKIKLGDMVRVKENLHEPFCLDADLHLKITNMPPHAVSQKEWKVIKVEVRRDCAEHIYTLNNGDSFIYNIPEDCVELVEPTEQTEAEKKPNVGSIKIPVEVDLSDSYWQAYTANLAKEVALKVANKYTDPKEAAEYAVSVAAAVVEGLKRK